MRIGIFSDAYKPYISGVVNSIDMLKVGLEELGHEVYIITVKLPPFDYEIDEKNVIIFDGKKFPLKNFSNYSYITKKKEKLRYLKTFNFDVVHVHTEFSIGVLGLSYSKEYNVPCVTTYHTNYEDYFHYFKTIVPTFIKKAILYRLLKKAIKFMEKTSDVYVVPTKKIEKVFQSYNFKFPVEIIPTGIDLKKFSLENQNKKVIEEIKDKYNLHNKFVFSFVGRVSFEKSIDLLINAFNEFNKENSVLMICGNGPAFNDLNKLVKELNIEDKVIFTGNISYEDVSYYYHCSDLFINASTTETQGLTFIEALASSLPLLIKEDEATRELLIPNYNGLYYNTKEELINNMNLIYSDKEMLKKLQNNALLSVEKYSKEEYAISLEKIYKKIIDEN